MISSLLFIQKVGVWPMILIILVVLILFGGKKIPELMKGVGKGMKDFKDATKGEDDKKSEEDKK